MSRKLIRWSSFVSLGLAAAVSMAQQPPPPGDRAGGDRPPRDGDRGPPPFMAALDVNSDGMLDQDEIEMAVDSLKTLDKNRDGKLTMEELMPPRAQGGPGGPSGPGGPGGFGDPGGRGGPGGGFAALVQEFDKNKDGALSKDEVPEDRQRIFEFADRNKDGKIDQAEIESMARGFGGGGDMFATLDKDGDGKVSKAEAPERMQGFFDRIDTNKDGFLSKEETEAMRNRGGGGGARPGGDRAGGERPARPPE